MDASAIRKGKMYVTAAVTSRMRRMAGAAVVMIAMCLPGCMLPERTFEPERDPASLDDVTFLHYLASVPVATVDEGMRAVLMLRDNSAHPSTYEQRYAALEGLGAVKRAWHLEPNRILDKGTLGYMLRKVCKLPHSVNEWFASLTGLGDRRYALKSCIYAGLMPYGRAQDPVTGGELLSAMTAAEQRLQEHGGETP